MTTRLMTSFFCTVFLCAQVLVASPAWSGMVTTGDALAAQQRGAEEARIMATLQRDTVSEYLADNGVSLAQVESRLQRLTDAEVTQLAEQMDDLPAGADVLELVVVIFLVLILLDLLKVTDVFPGI